MLLELREHPTHRSPIIMSYGTGMLLILLIGCVLPLAILFLVAVGWLIKFMWDVDPDGLFWRPIIKYGGIWIVLVIGLLIFFVMWG